MTISPIRGRAPAKRTKTKYGMRGRVADISSVSNFIEISRGFQAVRGQIWGIPLTLTVALTIGQHYRAACDFDQI